MNTKKTRNSKVLVRAESLETHFDITELFPLQVHFPCEYGGIFLIIFLRPIAISTVMNGKRKKYRNSKVRAGELVRGL